MKAWYKHQGHQDHVKSTKPKETCGCPNSNSCKEQFNSMCYNSNHMNHATSPFKTTTLVLVASSSRDLLFFYNTNAFEPSTHSILGNIDRSAVESNAHGFWHSKPMPRHRARTNSFSIISCRLFSIYWTLSVAFSTLRLSSFCEHNPPLLQRVPDSVDITCCCRYSPVRSITQ